MQLWQPVHLSGWIISIILMRACLSSPADNLGLCHYVQAARTNAAAASEGFIVDTLARARSKSLMQIKLGTHAAVDWLKRGDNRIRSGKARAGRVRINDDA